MNLADMVALLDYCEGDVSPIYNFLYGWFRNEKNVNVFGSLDLSSTIIRTG